MRGGPGTNHEVVASVRYGVIFEPLERRGDWIRVRHSDGATGWISASLLWPADIL
jgi:SH3-like domain-containing protein